jgi:hypothetical protein
VVGLLVSVIDRAISGSKTPEPVREPSPQASRSPS